MPSLPRKARNGDDFKSYTTSAINKLIDYLHSMRPKDSPDIKVKESASGLMFELANRPAKTPQVISVGGGGASGLVATVSGNTASVAVSGSSPLSIVAGQNVTITGGTNGEVIIGSTASGGGGMMPPDYNHTLTIITSSSSTLVRTYTEDVWLIGSAQAQFGEHDNDDNSVVLSIGTVYTGYRVIDGSIAYGTTVPSPYNSITIGAAFCFFVPAGTPFYFTITGNAYVTCEVHSTLT